MPTKKAPSANWRVHEALTSLLEGHGEVTPSDDGTWLITLDDATHRAAWSRFGWAPEVRDLLGRESDLDVVVAPTVSPGARELLRDSGVGWIEVNTGAADVRLGRYRIREEGHPIAEPVSDAAWTPAALVVAEALLTGTRATVGAVVDRTGVATGTATRILSRWTASGLLSASASRGSQSARALVDRRDFLERYSAAVGAARQPSIRVAVLWRDAVGDLLEIMPRLDEAGIRWAATGPLAADLMAPYLTLPAPWRLLIDSRSAVGLQAAAKAIGGRPATGGRLTLEMVPSVHSSRLFHTVNGLSCAPWPRVYADLRTSGVRGEEAAEVLYEQWGSA